MPKLTAKPGPTPGLVIPYAYLWRHQHEAREEGGRKVRPSLIVVAVKRTPGGKVRVVVVPITSQRPDRTRSAIALPPRVKAHLGLGAARSWVICDEYNEFDWPGVDLGATPAGAPAFGHVPGALVERVRAEMLAARARGALKGIPRSE